MKLWWRTKPAADEYVDITDSTRAQAIREALYQAEVDRACKILRVSGKPGPKGATMRALVHYPTARP